MSWSDELSHAIMHGVFIGCDVAIWLSMLTTLRAVRRHRPPGSFIGVTEIFIVVMTIIGTALLVIAYNRYKMIAGIS